MSLIRRLIAMFRRERAGVVHTHGLDPMFYGGIAARLAGVPLRIHTQHNTQIGVYGWRGRLKLRAATPFFSKIVAVGAEADRVLAAAGVGARRRTIIRNGVDQSRFRGAQPLLPSEIGARPGERIVGAVARLSPEKGVHRLLEAFAILAGSVQDVRLVVAGDGPQKQALELLASRLSVAERVTLLGFRDRVERILPLFDLFVLPSLTEGVPMALLEAMAAGRACIATAVGGVPEVVVHGSTGVLVPPDDPEALAGAMSDLLSDAPRRARMGVRAAEAVRFGWNQDRMACAYAALYRDDPPQSVLARTGKALLRALPRRFIAWNGPGRRAEVALTFDDGPHPEYTPRILSMLQRHGVRASFFLVGRNAARHPELVKAIADGGHELGNHSHSHPRFELLDWREALAEIDRTQVTIESLSGAMPRLWRPPRGTLSLTSLLCPWLRGLTLVMWSVDLKDFRAQSRGDVVDRLERRPLRRGDIVLYHGHNEASLAAISDVVAAAAEARLTTVTVSRLLS